MRAYVHHVHVDDVGLRSHHEHLHVTVHVMHLLAFETGESVVGKFAVMMIEGIWSMHEGHAVAVLHNPMLQGHNVMLELVARDHIIVMVVEHHMVSGVMDKDVMVEGHVVHDSMVPMCVVPVNVAKYGIVHVVVIESVGRIHVFHFMASNKTAAIEAAVSEVRLVEDSVDEVALVEFSMHWEVFVPFEVTVFEGDVLEVHHMKMHVGEVDILKNDVLNKFVVHVHILEGLIEDVVSLHDHWHMSCWHHNYLGKGKRKCVCYCDIQ